MALTAEHFPGTQAAGFAATHAFAVWHAVFWGAFCSAMLSVAWSGWRKYALKLTYWEVIALIPGASLGAIVGAFTSGAGAGADYGILLFAALSVVLPLTRSVLTFASGIEILAALASLLFGVPAAIAGVIVGLFFHAAGLGFEIGYLVGGLPCVGRLAFWYYQGWKLQTPGYLAPYPTKFERGLYVWLCWKIVNTSLGQLVVKGRERLQSTSVQGGIYGGNHQNGLDFLIARLAVLFSFRQITQVKQIGGLRSGLGAFSGAFGVPSEGGKSTGNTSTVIEGGAAMLSKSSKNKMLLYFQGKLVYDNVQRYEDYRTGAVRMLQLAVDLVREGEGDAAAEEFASQIGIFLKAIHYWDSCERPSLVRKGFAKLWVVTGYGDKPKYGATVVLGEPIPFNSLPKDPATGKVDARKATNMIRDCIQCLLIEAKLFTAGVSDASVEVLRTAAKADGTKVLDEDVLASLPVEELDAILSNQSDAQTIKLVYPQLGEGLIQPSCG